MTAANEYRFVTHWPVPATPEQIYAILSNPCELPRWWPQVYLSAREMEPGIYELHTRGAT